MRRPLFVLLIGLVLGELCGYLLYLTGVMIPASLFLAVLCFHRTAAKGKPFFIWLFLGSILLGNLLWCVEERKVEEAKTFALNVEERECLVRGRIILRKETESTVSFTVVNPVFILHENRISMRGKCLLRGKAEDQTEEFLPVPGETGSFSAVLSFPEKEKNPGGFNEQNYDLANGVYLKGKIIGPVKVEKKADTVPGLAFRLKRRMEAGFLDHLSPDDAAMLSAMAFGDKSGLSLEQRKLYEENGMMHLLAVSGLHISGVGGRIYRRLRRSGWSYPAACSGGALMLLFYGCMTGWGTSVLRAVIMYMVFLTAEYLGYAYDLITAMSLSGILMLVEHPYRLLDSGFQISFAAVGALGLILPAIQGQSLLNEDDEFFLHSPDSRKSFAVMGVLFFREWKEEGKSFAIKNLLANILKNIKEGGKTGIVSGFVVFMATAPLIMRVYYECTPYSILLNPLVLPLMGPLLLCTLFSGILGLFGAGELISVPAVCILRGYSFLFTHVRKLPASLIITGCPSLGRILMIYVTELIFILILVRERRREGKREKKRILPCLFIIILIGLMIVCPPVGREIQDLRITMLDVGQGDSILLQLPGRKSMLIDGGSSSKENVYEEIIRPALWYYGLSKLDYVIISHMDEDHISGIRELLESGYPVKQLITGSTYIKTGLSTLKKIDYEKLVASTGRRKKDRTMHDNDRIDQAEYDICRLCKENGTSWHVMERGDSLEIGDIKFRCLHPEKKVLYEDRNQKSLTLIMEWRGFRALFPGDLGQEQEENILNGLDKRITLLKTGHHGSKYSTGNELLDRIRPAYAFISVGTGNFYGHPHRDLLKRLEEHGARIYQTKDHSAIWAETDGKSFTAGYWSERR